jgi:catechol 2,3-dioxygenase
MDAPNPSTLPTFANRTPLRIGAVSLIVRDLDQVATYYKQLLGLSEIGRTPNGVKLGAGGVPFLELEHRPDAKPDDAREAGLFHTAFLMPTRADLARWILHISRDRTPVSGASDHGVSEAFYLDDPEGNGVEVYADRPPEKWSWKDGSVNMPTVALDVEDIVREVDSGATYDTAPGGLRIGHIHLRVGDLVKAQAFYTGAIGLDVTRARDGAAFMSSGRYHHHVGANIWRSNGAGMRDPDRAGLNWFALEAADDAASGALRARLQKAGAPLEETAHGAETVDPFGNRIRLTKA